MLYSDKMTKNMQNIVIFEWKHLSEELKSSKKRLIMMLSLLRNKGPYGKIKWINQSFEDLK